MGEHDPEGDSLCIHSVTVSSEWRRRGIGRWMMIKYTEEMKNRRELNRILLLCKENLISFYQSCGFQLKGESKVVHGREKWYDMFINCKPESIAVVVPQFIQPGPPAAQSSCCLPIAAWPILCADEI